MNKLLSFVFVSLVACVTPPVWAQDAQGDAKAGEKKIAMCIGCHGIEGYKASFPEIHSVPMISGQNAKYIVAAGETVRCTFTNTKLGVIIVEKQVVTTSDSDQTFDVTSGDITWVDSPTGLGDGGTAMSTPSSTGAPPG